MSKPDTYLQSAHVLVSIAGVATADALVPGAGSALAGVSAVRDLTRRLLGKAPKLQTRIASELETALTKPGFLTDTQRKLIPQMIEKGAPTGREIMAAQRNPQKICATMLGKLTDPAHRPELLQTAFTETVAPILETLLEDTETNDQLRAAFDTAVAESLAHIAAQVETLTDQFKDTVEELGITKGLLLGLAKRIAADVDDIHAAHAELDRAIDIAKGMEAQAALPSNTGDQIDAVLARVTDLNDEDRLDEADAEITRALSEIDAEQDTLTARKSAMLDLAVRQSTLRRDAPATAVRAAARVALDHADQPALFNALRALQDDWYARGLRFGSAFDLSVSIEIGRLVVDAATDEIQHGTALNDLAIALQQQGTRTAGPEGANMLTEAVTAYRAALTVYTQADHPVHWATTQNNLGNALQHQGTRTAGPGGADLLAEAVAAYRAALTVYTKPDHPVDWAMTQNNLGNALSEQGTRTAGPEGAALLAEAVTAYRAALTVRTKPDHPEDWAQTQNNLGTALQDQGTRTAGPGGADLLADAVTAYRAALTVRTEADEPVRWAMTQNNLGTALQQQGTRTAGPGGADLLAEAVTAYRAALTVRTEADEPVNWAMTQENLALAEEAIADHDATPDPAPHLRAALAHVETALTVFDPEHMSYNFAKATDLRDRLRDRLDGDGGPDSP